MDDRCSFSLYFSIQVNNIQKIDLKFFLFGFNHIRDYKHL
jgi:hypothetical protein